MALTCLKDGLEVVARQRSKLFIISQKACTLIKDQVTDANFPQIAFDAKDWLSEHPFYVASGVLFVGPSLVTVPVLGAAGFGTNIAGGRFMDVNWLYHRSNMETRDLGSAAAAIQSASGPIVAGGLFATLQSAGAAGYGLPIVNSAVQGAIGAVNALNLGYQAFLRKW